MSFRSLLLIWLLSNLLSAVSLIVQAVAWPPVVILAARLAGLEMLPFAASFTLGYYLSWRDLT